MPLLTSCHTSHTSLDGDTIVAKSPTIADDDFYYWKKIAVFDVPIGASCFQISFTIPHRNVGFIIGIVRRAAAADLQAKGSIDTEVGYGIIHCDGGKLEHYTVPRGERAQLPKFKKGQILHMRFESEARKKSAMSFTIEDGVSTTLKMDIIEAEYLPFIIFRDDCTTKVIAHNDTHKRKFDAGDKRGNLERMWKQRRFTDAEIQSKQGIIPVHRAVLCSSPVLDAAFSRGFEETASCRIKIDDVPHDVVEAFVQYIYTGDVPEHANWFELVGLAHRYDESDLVGACSMRIAQEATSSNICESVRALRLLKEHAQVREAWNSISGLIKNDAKIRAAVMMGI